jgi:hypothetical protein
MLFIKKDQLEIQLVFFYLKHITWLLLVVNPQQKLNNFGFVMLKTH